jgi:hypothetical protein
MEEDREDDDLSKFEQSSHPDSPYSTFVGTQPILISNPNLCKGQKASLNSYIKGCVLGETVRLQWSLYYLKE